MVLFAYFFSMRQAIDELDQQQVIALRLMGASRVTVVRVLTLRSAVPHLLGATRIGLPLAFGIEVFAELRVPTVHGLGVLLSDAANNLDPNGAMAVALFIVVVAYLLDLLIGAQLRRYTKSVGLGMR
jgi:NitT/TauT family transport system permease protein